MSVSLTAHHHPVLKFEMNGRTTPLLHTPAFLTKEKKKIPIRCSKRFSVRTLVRVYNNLMVSFIAEINATCYRFTMACLISSFGTASPR